MSPRRRQPCFGTRRYQSKATPTRCRAAGRGWRARRSRRGRCSATWPCPGSPGPRSASMMRRRMRTGRLVVERTRGLRAAPGVKTTRRHTQEPEDNSQRYTLARPIHRCTESAAWGPPRRSPEKLKPEVCKHGQRQPEQRRELLKRRRSFRFSCRSSVSVRSATSTLTTTAGAAPSHPRAVERGTPKSVAMVRSPLRWTSSGADGHSVAGGGTWSSCG